MEIFPKCLYGFFKEKEHLQAVTRCYQLHIKAACLCLEAFMLCNMFMSQFLKFVVPPGKADPWTLHRTNNETD